MSFDLDESSSIPIFFSDEDSNCLDGHSHFDILLGKEKAIFNHSGNKRFRAIINHNVHKYMNAPIKSKKSKVVRIIHAAMKKAGFRFLKKNQADWSELEEAFAREKVSHALRDKVREILRPTKFDRSSSERLYPVITSMARMIKRNQMLLNKATESLSAKKELSKSSLSLQQHVPENSTCFLSPNETSSAYPPLQHVTGYIPVKKSLTGESILDLIESMPPRSQQQGPSLGSKRYFNNFVMNEAAPRKISGSSSTECSIEGRNLCQSRQRISTEESLFGGLADEIADAEFEISSITSSVGDHDHNSKDMPIQYVSFPSEL
mmetsp:Transcript_17434/g.26379  ORF Transcript_17434/g.26379 Transcript_17434/m.26379 type:complete len:320 (+) Transcript_17434:122-1081(+)